MKQLPNTYRKNGYNFTLFQRTGDVAIYKQTDETECVAYEVFEVLKYPERMIAGTKIAATEACPSNEQWGSKGYTYRDLGAAMKRAEIMVEDIKRRNLAKRMSPESKRA